MITTGGSCRAEPSDSNVNSAVEPSALQGEAAEAVDQVGALAQDRHRGRTRASRRPCRWWRRSRAASRASSVAFRQGRHRAGPWRGFEQIIEQLPGRRVFVRRRWRGHGAGAGALVAVVGGAALASEAVSIRRRFRPRYRVTVPVTRKSAGLDPAFSSIARNIWYGTTPRSNSRGRRHFRAKARAAGTVTSQSRTQSPNAICDERPLPSTGPAGAVSATLFAAPSPSTERVAVARCWAAAVSGSAANAQVTAADRTAARSSRP